jgi:Putative MetA-pathway of phenol degradation
MPARKTHSLLLTTALASSLASTAVFAHWEGSRPDAHAPIGVMADHTHKTGEWMFSYRAMHMEMDGSRNGKNRISTNDVHNQFMVAPEKMDMEMHMLGAMYAPNDNVTLNIMVPYIKNSMDHITRMGATFETVGEGLGDISLGAIFNLASKHVDGDTPIQHRLLANLSVSLPTGDDDIRDDTLMPNVKLPYPMQVGSGTYTLMPGLTYLGQQVNGKYSWGAQAMATIHIGTNDEGWSRGDKLQVTGWVARLLSENVSASVRLNAQKWDRIDGRDNDLTTGMVQTANPSLLASKRADLSLGLNVKVPGTGHRFAIEVGKPVWQNLDGPQLETDMIVTAGWQWAL